MANTDRRPSTGDLNLSLTNPRLTPLYAELGLAGTTSFLDLGNQTRITPLLGSVTLTASAPGLISANLVTPNTSSLTLSGIAPLGPLTPTTGSLTVTGLTSPLGRGIVPVRGSLTLSLGATDQPDTGSVSLTGAAPTVQSGVTIPVLTPARGTLTVAGVTPVVASGLGSAVRTPDAGSLLFGEGTVLIPLAGSLTVAAGAIASLRLNTIDIATVGALTITGSSLTPLINVIKTTPVGTLTLTPQVASKPNPPITPGTALLLFLDTFTPTLIGTRIPGTATLTLTGIAGTLPGNPQPVTSSGALALTGLQPAVQFTSNVMAQPGAATLTLASTPPGGGPNVVAIVPTGTLVLQGAASQVVGRQITPGTATLVLEALASAAPPIIIGGPTIENPAVGHLALSGQTPVVLTFRLTRGYRFVVRPRRGPITVPERTE